MEWETVIGLEIHAQLATRSKIFSGSATAYGAEPNTQANLVDLGYPGVLPVLNGEAVRMAVRFGLAIGATIARRSVFARKNYFYPGPAEGLPDQPVRAADRRRRARSTIVLEDGTRKSVGITRAHLEEDAGKSLHEDFHGLSGIDLNRAGTPLLEIVSEPDMRSAKEAVAYMKKIHTLVRYLEHLRRQHAGRLVPLRRQRLGAPEGRRRSSARAPRSRTSTRSASSRRRSTTRSSARSS